MKTVMLTGGVFQMQDKVGNCATLVVGRTRAILFDTMLGLEDLKATVEQITDLPYIVINSHGHMDHMGGNYQFEEVFLHPADKELIKPNYENVVDRLGKVDIDLNHCLKSLSQTDCVKDLEVEKIYDLGGLHAKVIPLPGHTKGSIGLLLIEKNLLLAGDACTPQMCLFMDGAQKLEVYRETLETLKKEKFNHFILGHFMRTFPKSILDEFEKCIDLVGVAKGYPFQYSLIPKYKGTMYVSDFMNQEIGETICIITK